MITSRANEKVRWIRDLQDHAKARARDGAFVVEGIRMVEEAVVAGAKIRLALHLENLHPKDRSILNRLAKMNVESVSVTPEVMQACSDTVTSQNMLAIVEKVSIPIPSTMEWVIIADGISNPGNLGTLIRTAEAFDAQALFLMPGCADAFNPKVVRGAMGAHFRLPLREQSWKDLPGVLPGFRFLMAEAREGARADAADWSGKVALILGGEAAGPGEDARALCHQAVHIPMRGGAESLNAAMAGGILMYEGARSKGLLL